MPKMPAAGTAFEPKSAPGTARTSALTSGWILAIAIVVAIVGVLVATAQYGIGLTPDSVTYLVGARSLADNQGYVSLGGEAIGHFPPGYSAVLSLGERFGQDTVDFARLLSIASVAATVLLGYLLASRHIRSPGIRATATLLIAASAVMLEIYSKALSEHLFVPVIVGFLLVCEELLFRPRALPLLTAAIVLSWAAFYLRYAGVVAVGVGALVILIGSWTSGKARSLLRAAVFAGLALSAPALWAYRNQDAVGEPFGQRADASATPLDNVYRTANELSQWLATDVAPPAARALIGAVALAALVAIGVAVLRRSSRLPEDWRAMLPITIFIVVYLGYFIVSTSVVAIAPVNSRLMLPLFVPVIVLGAWLFERVQAELRSPAARTALTAVGIAFLVANLLWFSGRVVNTARDGAGGYASERWRESELLDELDQFDLSVLTYSNDPTAIALFADENVRSSPAKTYFQSDEATGDLPEFLRAVGCAQSAQLIWFEPGGRPYRYTLDELQQDVRMHPILERGDGAIYTLTPAPGSEADC